MKSKLLIKRITRLLLVVFTIVSLTNGFGFFTNMPVQAATSTIYASADTDTQSDNAGGTNNVLNASQWCSAFYKFNLSSISQTVTNAKFRVYHQDHVNTHTLNLCNASPDSWVEGGTKPTLGSVITSKSVTANGYVEFDVTSLINQERVGDDLITFGLSTNLGSWEKYASRETATNKPQLVITVADPTPPPTGSTTLNPSADTDTQSDVAAGTNTVLNASQWCNAFYKFSLSSISQAATNAKFRVYHQEHVSTHTLNLCNASPDSWVEGGTKPTLGSVITTKSVTANGYVEFDVTSLVNQQITGDDLITFGLSTNLGSWEKYASRQSSTNKPQLVITYSGSTPAPTPIPTAGPTATPTGGPTPPPTGSMKLGVNLWDKGWGNGWTDYFVSGVNWSTVSNPWKSEFITDLAPFKCIRFMDWVPTNNSTTTDWSQRVQKTADHYTSNGVAFEWMIDLCNRTNKDLWLTVPHMANSNYWTQLATLVKNNLNSNLKCYIEYSNETWNYGFTQAQYTENQGVAGGLPGSNQWYKAGAYSIWQSTKIFKAFRDVFTTQMASRVVRVAAFSGNYDIFDQGYNNVINNSSWNPYGEKADMIAIAPYVGNGMDGAAGNIQSLFHSEIDATFTDRVQTAVTIANKYNVKLGCYEGGQHLLTNAHLWSRNSAIYSEYTYMLNRWKPYFTLFNQYTLYSSFASGGAWGAKEAAGQSNSTAHKYRALLDWANANP